MGYREQKMVFLLSNSTGHCRQNLMRGLEKEAAPDFGGERVYAVCRVLGKEIRSRQRDKDLGWHSRRKDEKRGQMRAGQQRRRRRRRETLSFLFEGRSGRGADKAGVRRDSYQCYLSQGQIWKKCQIHSAGPTGGRRRSSKPGSIGWQKTQRTLAPRRNGRAAAAAALIVGRVRMVWNEAYYSIEMAAPYRRRHWCRKGEPYRPRLNCGARQSSGDPCIAERARRRRPRL